MNTLTKDEKTDITLYIVDSIKTDNATRQNSPMSNEPSNEILLGIYKDTMTHFKDTKDLDFWLWDNATEMAELLGIDNYHAIRNAEQGLY